MNNLITQTVLVACRYSNGRPNMVAIKVKCSKSEYDNKEHYTMAEGEALAQGYQGPYICFDEADHSCIANHVSALACPTPFTIKDASGNQNIRDLSGSLDFGNDAVWIRFDGYSDFYAEDDKGAVAGFEQYNGTAMLRVYGDINRDDPTKNITFEGAKNSNRTTLCEPQEISNG